MVVTTRSRPSSSMLQNGDMSFDDIMAEWNQKWSDAQESLGIEVTEK